MILGTALMIGALSLFLVNRNQVEEAQTASAELMPQLIQAIEEKEDVPTEPQTYEQPVGTPVEFLEPAAFEMTEVEIDGYGYIGYLSMPTIGRELPILADWDYDLLKKAPCRFTGTIRGNDLVLMAHNYRSHFGKLSELRLGDRLTFTDMDGVVTVYEVVAKDILDPSAVEELTAGIYDLALFTCTYGGQSRVTVYCDKVG